MGIFEVHSIGKDKRTGSLYSRKEYVDTKKNRIFAPLDSAEDVKEKYEDFWGLDKYSPEIVSVIDVKEVDVKSKGENWGIKIKKLKEVL